MTADKISDIIRKIGTGEADLKKTHNHDNA